MLTALVFAKDLAGMRAFYVEGLELVDDPAASSDGYRVLTGPGTRFALHAIPPDVAASITIADPPVGRSSTPIKLIFGVPDVARTPRAARRTRGPDIRNDRGRRLRCRRPRGQRVRHPPVRVMHSAWELGPFTPHAGPILGTDPELRFRCPVSGHTVRWAAKDVFNPGAVAHDGQVYLLVRAEDGDARVAGTSRIGLAVSDDGVQFELAPEPVLFPADDEWRAWEWPGGCEDPRVVESPEGGFVCTYTAFNGRTACLFVATSPDLRTWRKHGPAFAGTRHVSRWSKSGSIVTELRDGRLIAVRVRDRYWMYWGEGTCFAATSDDLIHWQPLEYEADRDRYLTRADTGRAPPQEPAPARGGAHRARDARVATGAVPATGPLRLVARGARAARGEHGPRHRARVQRRESSAHR